MALKQNIQERFDNLEAIITEYASEFERLYKEKLRDDDFKASGDLINSIETKVKVGSDYYIVTFKAKDYWKYVEEGRRAGKWPPKEPILKWIKVKKILPQPDKDGNLPTPESLAFLIQRAIGKKGTIKRYGHEGSHIVYETVQQLNADYIPLMQEALQEDAEHFVFEALDDSLKTLRIW